jgi:hypothetical protein
MVMTEIVSQHAEEAEFLWLLQSRAICTPHYALKDLARIDGRAEAHLEEWRVAEESGWKLSKGGAGE